MSKQRFIKGTLILCAAGLLTRLIGFFYRIFLSHTIGAEGIGIYQLILPLQTLMLSISTAGIQMAISRLCASCFATKKNQEGCRYFFLGTLLSFSLSAFLSFLLYHYAGFFAGTILKDMRTEDLIRLLSFSIPLSAIHTCISSFYIARKDTRLPSFLQLSEQVVRIGITYLLFQIFSAEGKTLTAWIAVAGSLAGEVFSALTGSLFLGMHLHGLNVSLFSESKIRQYMSDLCSMAVPLSLNRILLTLLGSIEVVLIPGQLQLFGQSHSQALSVYGIFTGMALPLILFPSTITGSVSTLLMPSVAELQALGHRKRIRYVTRTICRLTFLMGALCCLGFFSFGTILGNTMFHNASAGNYIRSMAFLCPFLYLHTTLASILHGLGRSATCLIHNLIGAGIRLLFVMFSIPRLGIRGYLYGLLVCEMILTFLHLFALQKELER